MTWNKKNYTHETKNEHANRENRCAEDDVDDSKTEIP